MPLARERRLAAALLGLLHALPGQPAPPSSVLAEERRTAPEPALPPTPGIDFEKEQP